MPKPIRRYGLTSPEHTQLIINALTLDAVAEFKKAYKPPTFTQEHDDGTKCVCSLCGALVDQDFPPENKTEGREAHEQFHLYVALAMWTNTWLIDDLGRRLNAYAGQEEDVAGRVPAGQEGGQEVSPAADVHEGGN